MDSKEINKLIEQMNEDDKENISDTYHTFKELYAHRVGLYIALVNSTIDSIEWHKSKLHHDGSEYENRFILMGYINGKQVSYHLPNTEREKVLCESREKSDKRDGHTSEDVLERLESLKSK